MTPQQWITENTATLCDLFAEFVRETGSKMSITDFAAQMFRETKYHTP